MRWAAFDFETATGSRDSACALGVVLVEDGRERYRHSWLIQPPGNRYNQRNIAIHGITPAHTEYAPGFAQVWAEVEYLVGDAPLVAHNAGFDRGVLVAAASASGTALREHEIWCSLRLARRAWPELGRWNLPAVAGHVGATLVHHDALSDAAACSDVVRGCITTAGAAGLADLGALLEVSPALVGAGAEAALSA